MILERDQTYREKALSSILSVVIISIRVSSSLLPSPYTYEHYSFFRFKSISSTFSVIDHMACVFCSSTETLFQLTDCRAAACFDFFLIHYPGINSVSFQSGDSSVRSAEKNNTLINYPSLILTAHSLYISKFWGQRKLKNKITIMFILFTNSNRKQIFQKTSLKPYFK